MAKAITAVPIRITEKEYDEVERMAELGCDTKTIAHALGMDRASLYKKMHVDRELGRRYKKGRAKGNEEVYGILRERCRKGDTIATIFHLKTRCGAVDGDKSNAVVKALVEYVEAHPEETLNRDQLVEEIRDIAEIEAK